MRVRADFSEPAVVELDTLPWLPSPAPGVDRRMLDRIGEEVARATSVVRYAPDSRFPTHVHGGGEEIFVLEGVFSDEHGDYPAGTYLRNPPGTAHAPFTKDGCTIFVKLHQMPEGDAQTVVPPGTEALHHDPTRGVQVHRKRWDGPVELGPESHEVLLLAGTLTVFGATVAAPAWVRIPRGAGETVHTSGAEVWHKSGHLPEPAV